MAKLINIIAADNFVGEREFWALGNGFEIVASTANQYCALFISGGEAGKKVELISKYLEAKSFKHNLTATIDSYFIEVAIDEKEEALALIESWKW